MFKEKLAKVSGILQPYNYMSSFKSKVMCFTLFNNNTAKVIKIQGSKSILPLDLIYRVDQVPKELLGEYSALHIVEDVLMIESPSQVLILQP